jgi:hypothetical protein
MQHIRIEMHLGTGQRCAAQNGYYHLGNLWHALLTDGHKVKAMY